MGQYSHFAGSLHIYRPYIPAARQYLEEGWQDSPVAAMPSMPPGDPWPNIRLLLEAEEAIRAGRAPRKRRIANLPDYWRDLVRLYRSTRSPRKSAGRKLGGVPSVLNIFSGRTIIMEDRQ